MITKSKIDAALAAAAAPVKVESAGHLQRCIDSWMDCELLGIDTEFVRERTWRADLGLVQVSDGKTVWLIDPVKIGSVESLAALLSEQSLVKVLHAPSEDLDVLQSTTGAVPEPLFDTQIACAMLGEPLQMAYHKTAEWLLGIAVDKGETRSNWRKRPLRPAQLHYAALDVCLLPIMHDELKTRLQDLGRIAWLEEECAMLVSKARSPADLQQAWQRVRGAGRLDGISLAVLQVLAAWRDQQAERLNRARGFFIKDEVLLAIARNRPGDLDALSALDALSPRTMAAHGGTITGLIAGVIDSGTRLEPPKTLNAKQRRLMAAIKARVGRRAKELGVEPALLASRRDLESLVQAGPGDPLPERFTGWRRGVIIDELLSMMEET